MSRRGRGVAKSDGEMWEWTYRYETGGEVRGRLAFIAVVLCGASSGLSVPAVFGGVHMSIEWDGEGVEEWDLDWD